MKNALRLTIAFTMFIIMGCDSTVNQNSTKVSADVIYFGGDIITMEGSDAQFVEALALKEGKIVFVGTKKETENFRGDKTEMKDLQGKTLLPGFIDSHSHLSDAMNIAAQANVSSPPVGNCTNLSDIIASLEKCRKENNIKEGEWIFGWGYDETQLSEKRTPNKTDLDKAFPKNPVFIRHVSGHIGVANSLALADGKIDKNTKDPNGGLILRMPGTTEPSGVLQEMAIHHYVEKITEVFSGQKTILLEKALGTYVENGVTTAQEGFTDASSIAFFKQSAKDKNLSIDVVSLASFIDMDKNLNDSTMNWGNYNNHLKFEGTKIVADGSPQGKTAFFTKPYFTQVSGCRHDCRGFSNVTQEQLDKMFELAYKNKNQLFVHCNGDATMDMLIIAHENTCKKINEPLDADRRTVIIHSNFVRLDQLQKYKEYNLLPSFFTNHAYFWGDVHVENLGESRAFFLSPIRTADSLGIIYTNHTDNIVTPINQLFTVWSAVNRVSRSGKIIGPNERATPYQALKSITINAAYFYFEEDRKGSLKEGKLADLVILDKNPISVDAMSIKDIKVLETIKEGVSVYKQNSNP